jgi:hypothetical protein
VRAHDGPRAAVGVQPQHAREALQVIVHEGVVQLLGGVLARRRHDAVLREEGELFRVRAAGRCGERRGVYAQPAEIAHYEAGGRERRAGEAQERVLRVRFEGDAVVEQRWDDPRYEKARISFFFFQSGKYFSMAGERMEKLTRRRR